LEIIKLALELAIRIHDDMPKAQREDFWVRHEKFLDMLDGLFQQLQPQGKAAK
jgi:hypothetical protein